MRVSTRNGHRFVPLEFERLAPPEQIKRAREFESRMLTRRTVRKFSPQTVERELIESALLVASRAPSGANQTAVAVCGDFCAGDEAGDPPGGGKGRKAEL